MAASAAPFPSPTRWSRTLAHTLLACAASLALHALALGGLAWLYHRSAALAPPAPEVRIASVYLAPAAAAPDRTTASEAATPEPVEIAPPAPVPRPRATRPEVPRPARAKDMARPRLVGPHPSLPPQAGEGATTLPAPAAVASAEPALPLPPLAGEGRDGGRSRDTRTHAGIEWRVQDWLAQHRHYPRAARRSGAEGTVWVRFVLDRRGDLQGSEILESSGHPVLDRAALDLLEKASPFPALPPELTTDEIELVLPIEYDLTRTGHG